MDELIAFLKARLDEDEQAAADAGYSSGGNTWTYADLELAERDARAGRRRGSIQMGDEPPLESALDGHQMFHIARHDPARVLAEVELKRRILDEVDTADRAASSLLVCLLALPYAGHPDYQESWRP